MKKRTHPEKLSKKDKRMVQLYVSDPKMTKTKAWQATHNSSTDNVTSLHSQATHAFSNPLVKMELAKYNGMIEDTMINTIQEWGTHEKPQQRGIAIDTAKYIHDKIHGKAKQQVQVNSTTLAINIDLTAEEDED